MKIINPTPITDEISFSAGYSNGCSVMIVHAQVTTTPIEKLHSHSKDSEYYYVLKGKLTLVVNESRTDIQVGQCLEVEPNEKHKIVNIVKETEYIIVRTNFLPAEKILWK